jgi:hypothetical protein
MVAAPTYATVPCYRTDTTVAGEVQEFVMTHS